jgi:electron transfer flavoprotein alpha subunit
MSEHEGVWVYSENKDLTIEMLGKGSELANKLQTQLCALLIGHNLRSQANELIGYGADNVIVADNPQLKAFQSETYLGVVAGLVKEHKPAIILIGSTRRGRELAARLATRLETGCVPDCTQLSLDEQKRLLTERIVYGGNASVTQVFQTKPQIACVPSRTFEKPAFRERKGEIIDASVTQLEAPRTELIEVKPIEAAAVKIEEAKVVIVGGRGVEKKEDFRVIEGLCHELGGQVGYTRPLAEDRKWFKGDWIGLSGHKIKPVLYISCGVSGVIQHVAGIRDSQIIVAINKDAEAPIFEIADYVVIGDLYEIVPALETALKKLLTPS